jgi:hypothetical protein
MVWLGSMISAGPLRRSPGASLAAETARVVPFAIGIDRTGFAVRRGVEPCAFGLDPVVFPVVDAFDRDGLDDDGLVFGETKPNCALCAVSNSARAAAKSKSEKATGIVVSVPS